MIFFSRNGCNVRKKKGNNVGQQQKPRGRSLKRSCHNQRSKILEVLSVPKSCHHHLYQRFLHDLLCGFCWNLWVCQVLLCVVMGCSDSKRRDGCLCVASTCLISDWDLPHLWMVMVSFSWKFKNPLCSLSHVGSFLVLGLATYYRNATCFFLFVS